MVTYDIPYGGGALKAAVDPANLKAVLAPDANEGAALESEEQIVRRALSNPIGQRPLCELARGKRRITLITSDHTRPVPSRLTLPILLEEIRSGNPEAAITILIATGLHRSPTQPEMRRMFGEAIVSRERICVNDAMRAEDFVSMGKLPSGADFLVNRLAAECDLLVSEGFIEPHFFAGYSGGRKSILPGVCAQETINENHAYGAVASPCATAGVLEGNPVHRDMLSAAKRVGLAFILNVALNKEKRVIAAFAGDAEEAHAAGVAFVRSEAGREAVTGDIVITGNSGYPLDQNLYQAPKAVATAEACAGGDGVIILCAECREGFGGENFKRLMLSGTPEEIDRLLRAIPPKETLSEQWSAQIFARVLKKHAVVLVSSLPPELVEQANMIPAESLEKALEKAYALKGASAQVVLIPDGVSTLVLRKEQDT